MTNSIPVNTNQDIQLSPSTSNPNEEVPRNPEKIYINQNSILFGNPMKEILIKNADKYGNVDINEAIRQGVLNFNHTFLTYLLNSIGVDKLHKSSLGYGYPRLIIVLDDEYWNVVVFDKSKGLTIGEGVIDDIDIKIEISKEEAVRALLSSDIKAFMKNSVINGNTKIETIAKKLELYSKGYLDLYNELT
ncbi:MAG: hypothetical protein QXW97_04055 [Candidatus Pacearchaeota archaeon]